jgi:UDP-N-acetylmuramate dehydrogenase
MGVQDLGIRAIAQAVINIRTSKLPDPKVIPNAGSFFKNPEITNSQYEDLRVRFPGIIAYPGKNVMVKLAAGWLIEQCGPRESISWKGYRRGDAGCHARQALVLVNYGKATGKDILELGEEIAASVKDKFNVILEKEVNAI